MLHTLSNRDPIMVAPPARPNPDLESDLLRVLQELVAAPTPSLDASPPLRQRVAAGSALLHEGAPARQICVVHAGTFKSVKTGDDGYEHVLGFALRGDLLGYDGLANGHYASAAIALEDSVVFTLPLRQFDGLRHAHAGFDHALQATLSRQISRAIELAELMSAVAADARLARFLLHVSVRMAEQGLSPRRLRLRMNRREIASHLGVAHETVSRSFGLLADRGFLLVANREVEIVDMEGLRAHAHCTRGPLEEPAKGAAPSRRALSRSSTSGSRSRWPEAVAA
ncbi:MAG: Crp/Fnr family transcriptional regulator [Rubrivivax sp.]|nr:Crp/Fnr family transcriptional regulator [Rubrivivax sp.]